MPRPGRSRNARRPTRRRRWRRRLHRLASRALLALACRAVPPLYRAYMGFVWATSRVTANGLDEVRRVVTEHKGVVALMWHEEVLTVAYAYPYLGFRGHTLASAGNAGQVITRVLEACGYVVFRGGSSRRASRRRPLALRRMIGHMRAHDDVLYGLTVDGSHGPPYRVKPGGIILAHLCGKPIFLVRTWTKRSLRLPTWDRAALPLPFNAIAYYAKGPYFAPESTCREEGLECFRQQLENDLIALAARSYRDMGQPCPAALTPARIPQRADS